MRRRILREPDLQSHRLVPVVDFFFSTAASSKRSRPFLTICWGLNPSTGKNGNCGSGNIETEKKQRILTRIYFLLTQATNINVKKI
jgi:hypothetical protein